MSTESVVWKLISSSIFEYETSKVVQIKSWKIGIMYRLFQLGIVLYVTLWVMYHDKGYQTFDYPVAGVTAKLKGIAFANLSTVASIGTRVWDTADFVIPPQQNSAFFVATNMVITPNQSLGRCDETLDLRLVHCSRQRNPCSRGRLQHLGSGVETGRCIPSRHNRTRHVCEVYGWCPTEHDRMPIPDQSLLASAPNFTVLLKNSIEFPHFKIKRRNILSWMTKDFLRKCRYNQTHPRNRFCPIFRLKDIIDYSESKDRNLIWVLGGLMSIHIDWNCNLDFPEDDCVPQYTFRRLDDFSAKPGKGWNFRYSYHYMEDGVEKRTLTKAYGIQFFITVSGRGGKFNFFKFSMNLGSGLALLGIASVLCDLFVLNIVRKRELYKKARVDSLKSILNHRGAMDHKRTKSCRYCTRNRLNNVDLHSTAEPEQHECNLLWKSDFLGMSPRTKYQPPLVCHCNSSRNHTTLAGEESPTCYFPHLNDFGVSNPSSKESFNVRSPKNTVIINKFTRNKNRKYIPNAENDTNHLPRFKHHSHHPYHNRFSQSFDCITDEQQFSSEYDKRYLTEFVRLCRSTDLPFIDD